MQRSILNFFSKVPDKNKDSYKNEVTGVEPSCSSLNAGSSPKILVNMNVDEDFSPKVSCSKRRRLVFYSSDDENENSPRDVSDIPQEKSLTNLYSCPSKRFARDVTNSPKLSSSSARSKCSSVVSMKKRFLETSSNDLFNTSAVDSCFTMDPVDGSRSFAWPHLTYPFLLPDRIQDACGHRPAHPDYDPRTLLVPEDFLRKQSPALRQWWILKSQNFDTLLFFKMGKFYELYHMDAVIAVEELKLTYMKGEFAHSGFPEIAFQRMADHLLHRGYKVARVEQTETPEAMTKRTSGRSGVDRVVRREICQVITPGTWFAPLRNGISSDNALDVSCATSSSQPISHSEMETDLMFNRYLLVILEGSGSMLIGIGQFSDDIHYSRMCTIVAHFPPSQILFERGNLSNKLRRMLKARLPSVPFEGLAGGKQFLSAHETICALESADYFTLAPSQRASSAGTAPSHLSKVDCWPADLLRMLDPVDTLERNVLPGYELAVRCLGAVVFYLRYCLTDTEILSLGLIHEYRPADVSSALVLGQPFYERQVNMVLDSVTMENLEILTNNFNGTLEGTLLERLDSCCTPFGRRLLRTWVVSPPCHPNSITKRQDAIQELMDLSPQLQSVRDALRRLPDLERLLTKIHIMGWNATRPDHPESRAIVVDETIYSKRKIMDFLLALCGFKSAILIIKDFSRFGVKSELLRFLASLREEGGAFPNYSEELSLFDKAFDHEKAKRDGCIVVEPGFDPEFDKACEGLERAEMDMEDFLAEQSDLIGCQLTYTGTGKNRFQIEVPETCMDRVPHAWEATGQRKGFRRFRPPPIKELFARLVIAEDAKQESMQGIMRRLFASFSSSYSNWQAAIRCIAELDCLISLANYSISAAAITCRPEFYPLDPGTKPFLEIEGGYHPCLVRSFSGGEITPNDVQLGPILGQEKATSTGFKVGVTTLLITGPNMGGKSTLMRQTALLVILAHLGCQIPATSCRLTPVDRVFTRIGASDRLISGQSTFFVELAETAVILNHATAHSLVLMDELGRGTSTRDGSALASAVLRYLTTARPSGPLSLFSTHYHNLVEVLQKSRTGASLEALDIGHMACLVGDGGLEEQPAEAEAGSDTQKITFLYKLVPSACPKSYGFNVARLAQIPDEVINKGVIMAREFEKATLVFSCLRDILSRKMDHDQAQLWRLRLANLSREKMRGT
ncbi:DNA mismatch repair protein Msh6 [Echinococcus granulosus]|uniref:DNA mismatch repair protein n=1 Tax=Echinococcus granulosus TaxID=6210 RepID=A0A068W7R2_ECHGR|nr:DNA mismatch repair protein Msh6 [Echinococcus granulosus]CDS15819.1 dna mismatch repair protein msh6 [Echinococcus granulosus]